jgi:hypothetical protein
MQHVKQQKAYQAQPLTIIFFTNIRNVEQLPTEIATIAIAVVRLTNKERCKKRNIAYCTRKQATPNISTQK